MTWPNGPLVARSTQDAASSDAAPAVRTLSSRTRRRGPLSRERLRALEQQFVGRIGGEHRQRCGVQRDAGAHGAVAERTRTLVVGQAAGSGDEPDRSLDVAARLLLVPVPACHVCRPSGADRVLAVARTSVGGVRADKLNSV